jgi:uncharacterized protein (TIGR02265 family)
MGDDGFRAPRFDGTIDVDAHVALLAPDARIKGFFFNDLVERARVVQRDFDPARDAGLPARRYTPFLDYPYADAIRLTAAVATVLHPRVPAPEGARRLGHVAFDVFFGTRAGRALFGFFAPDVERMLMLAPKAYGVLVSFGQLAVDRVEPGHVRVDFRRMPVLIESYQVGVFEGAIRHYGKTPDVRVRLHGLANGAFDVRWT